MKILVVDDEPLARARLTALVREIDPAHATVEAASGPATLQAVDESPPEVVLLDIRMPGMDGLEVARHLARMDNPPAVIFTTAYDAHALAAFQTHAVAYLLKPIERARLAEALDGAQRLTRAQLTALHETEGVASSSARTHISATTHGGVQLVAVTEVRFFRAEHKYVTVAAPGKTLLIEDSLSALKQEFGARFLRVHRNALVAPAYVVRLEREHSGVYRLHFDGLADTVEVSRRLVAEVKRSLRGGSGD